VWYLTAYTLVVSLLKGAARVLRPKPVIVTPSAPQGYVLPYDADTTDIPLNDKDREHG
jgi:hypothetical protein